MKIKRNTDEQLIIENNPIWLALFVVSFALVFVGVGLFTIADDVWTGIAFLTGGLVMAFGFSAVFIRRTQLILDRPRNLVELRRKSMYAFKQQQWQLSDLDHAEIETSRSGDTDTHRAVLIVPHGMDAGTHPVTLVYSSGRGAHRCAEAVNRWLDKTPFHP